MTANLIPILTGSEMKHCDAHTIAHEPITSIDLMERVAWRLAMRLETLCKSKKLHILCGPGNNGGDGYCIGRILANRGFGVRLTDCAFGKTASAETAFVQSIWRSKPTNAIALPTTAAEVVFGADECIIDCVFGTGLNNALSGEWKALAMLVNTQAAQVIAIDTPSGLFDKEAQGENVYIKAEKTLCIETPKPSFFYAENNIDFEIVKGGIACGHIRCKDWYLDPADEVGILAEYIPKKGRFTHKGQQGHVVLMGGGEGMCGAIALAASACVQMGAGKTTVVSSKMALPYISHLPEAMVELIDFDNENTEVVLPKTATVVCIGPGLGQTTASKALLLKWLKTNQLPLLLDADALNILAEDATLWNWVPKGSLITPHPGEFARLFGYTGNGKEKQQLARSKAAELGIYILAKDAYSVLYCADGETFINGTGGSWLAQGGSGDRLCGIIGGLWARTGDVKKAAIGGMYLAGLKNRELRDV